MYNLNLQHNSINIVSSQLISSLFPIQRTNIFSTLITYYNVPVLVFAVNLVNTSDLRVCDSTNNENNQFWVLF